MATITATARQTAIRLSEKIQKETELAEQLGVRVNFIYRKDAEHELQLHSERTHEKDR